MKLQTQQKKHLTPPPPHPPQKKTHTCRQTQESILLILPCPPPHLPPHTPFQKTQTFLSIHVKKIATVNTSHTVESVKAATLAERTHSAALKVLQSFGHGQLLAFLGTDHSPLVQICLVGQQHACSNKTRHLYGKRLASNMPVQMKQDTLMASSWPATCLFKWNKTPLRPAAGQQHACSNETRHPYGKQLASNMPVQMKQDTLMASSWPATCLFKWNKTPLRPAAGQQHACSNETRHPYGKQLASNMPVQMKQDTLMASSWPATCLFKWNKTPLWQAVGQQHACSNETRHLYSKQRSKAPVQQAAGQQHACSNEARHLYSKQLCRAVWSATLVDSIEHWG